MQHILEVNVSLLIRDDKPAVTKLVKITEAVSLTFFRASMGVSPS